METASVCKAMAGLVLVPAKQQQRLMGGSALRVSVVPFGKNVLRTSVVVRPQEKKPVKAVVAAAAATEAEGPAVAPSPDIPRPRKIGKGVVRLRLARLGRKKRPFFRIVATHSSWRRDGKAIELLGHYNPLHAPNDLGIVVKADRIKYWLGVGAQPSDTVAGILHKVGILKAPVVEPSQ